MANRSIWKLAGTAFCAVCLVGATGMIVRDRAQLLSQADAETQSIARLLATQAEVTLRSVNDVIEEARRVLGQQRDGRLSLEEARDRLNGLVIGSTAIGTIWAVRPDGTSWIDNMNAFPAAGNVSNRQYFQQARDGLELGIGPIEIGTLRPRPRLTVTGRLSLEGGAFGGVVVAGVDASHFITLFEQARFSPDLSAALVRERGDVLLSVGRYPGGAGLKTTAGSDSVVAASPLISEPGVHLVVHRDMTAVLRDWKQRSVVIAIVAVLLCLSFLTLVVMGFRIAVSEATARSDLKALADSLERRVMDGRREIETLLDELKHRVKNNLAVVVSVLKHQERSAPPTVRQALAEATSRIEVIAELYRDLDIQPGAEFDAAALVTKLSAQTAEAMRQPDRDIPVKVDADPVRLQPDSATPLGLFLNEALTNAFKHIARGAADPSINVTLRRLPDGFTLIVSNPSTGEPAGAAHGGTRFLDALSRQLGGRIEIQRGAFHVLTLECRSAAREPSNDAEGHVAAA